MTGTIEKADSKDLKKYYKFAKENNISFGDAVIELQKQGKITED